MIETNGWEQQPGGLYLAVKPFDKRNPEHRESVADVMRAVIQTVAQVHGAAFSEKGLRENMRAVYAGHIQVDLYLAKWEVCQPKALCLGGAISWPTYGIDPFGRMGRGIYGEDVCLIKSKMRDLIRTKPEGKDFPDESLVEAFDRIGLQKMFANDGARYKFGEVNLDNTRMMEPLIRNGGRFGQEGDSAVLEFQNFPNNLLDKFPMNAGLRPLDGGSSQDDNNFVVGWGEGGSDVRLIVTRGQATALGKARADIRPWHNGNLPDPAVLECVLASSMRTIRNEVEERKWNEPQSASGAYAVGQPDAVTAWAGMDPTGFHVSPSESWRKLAKNDSEEISASTIAVSADDTILPASTEIDAWADVVAMGAIVTGADALVDAAWADTRLPCAFGMSPRIPLLGSRREILSALHEACGHELLISPAQRPNALGAPMPDAHVFIINDKPMLDAFTATGARPRLFGHKPMMPGVNVVRNPKGLEV